MKDGTRGMFLYVVILAVILGILLFGGFGLGSSMDRLTDKEFKADLDEGKIVAIEVEPIKIGSAEMGNAILSYSGLSNSPNKTVYISNIEHFRSMMQEKYADIPVTILTIKPDSIWSEILPIFIMTAAMALIMFFIWNRMQGGGAGNAKMMNFGRSNAQVITKENNPIRFEDVAGLEEEKEELKEIVDFLSAPQKFIQLGARIPKGVLLVGPPGTGKTYLAKAVAGEAGVPFFSISGSDFVEMFVGVGASRVRDLFEQAKKNAPSIVFIDEIDAVGRQRGTGLGGGHDEREQTLNQLLVEMDGFGVNYGVIVMAATNRVDILDPAIMRPGRFDRQVVVGRPDVKGRIAVLKVHSRKKPLADDVNLEQIAKITAGFTPADLENLMNEAAIYAARADRRFITQEDIQRAFVKVGVGTEKKSRIISDREKNITAIHEAGHAIIHHVLPGLDPVHSISIIPTGLAGGYTMPLPEEDSMYMTKSQMENEIVSLLGGRVAEELEIGDVTTGASNDIERATRMARSMITRYGMSDDFGMVALETVNNQYLGGDTSLACSAETAALIDRKVIELVRTQHEKARQILTDNKYIMDALAEYLYKKETITGDEFMLIIREQTRQRQLDVRKAIAVPPTGEAGPAEESGQAETAAPEET